jgi:hypothetical protein
MRSVPSRSRLPSSNCTSARRLLLVNCSPPSFEAPSVNFVDRTMSIRSSAISSPVISPGSPNWSAVAVSMTFPPPLGRPDRCSRLLAGRAVPPAAAEVHDAESELRDAQTGPSRWWYPLSLSRSEVRRGKEPGQARDATLAESVGSKPSSRAPGMVRTIWSALEKSAPRNRCAHARIYDVWSLPLGALRTAACERRSAVGVTEFRCRE